MSASVECDASTSRERRFLSFSLDANSSTLDFDKLRSRTRSLSSLIVRNKGFIIFFNTEEGFFVFYTLIYLKPF